MTVAQSLGKHIPYQCWDVLLEVIFPGEQPLYFRQTNYAYSQKTLLIFHARGTEKAMRPSGPLYWLTLICPSCM